MLAMNPDRPQPPTPGEVLARFAIACGTALLLLSVAMLLSGAVYQPTNGLLATLLADDLALLWITLASTAHLVIVPAVCVAIALRDRRRADAGIPVPAPRSVWKGDPSIFSEERRP